MSTYTASLGLELITPGSQAGLWGNTTNNTFTLIDQAVTGVTPISFASASGNTYPLTDFNGALDESRSAVLNITGSASGANTVVIPNKQKTYLVRNNTGQDVVFQTASPSASYTVGAGYSILIFCDGNNNVFTGIASPGVGTLSVNAGGTGATTFTAGFVKSTGGTNALTSSATVNLATEVTGTLPVTRGGTGQTALTSGAMLIGNGTGNVAVLSGGAVGQVATWNGSTWTATAPASAGVSSLSAGTGIAVSGSTGAVTVSNSGVTSLSAGTGISLSGSTGSVTISSTATSGVTSFNGRTGAVTSSSGDYSSFYGSLSGTNSWTGVNTIAVAPPLNTGALNVTNNGASSPCLRTYSSPGGDTARGGEIMMTNGNASVSVRDKYLRVSAFGDLQVVNSAYSTSIFFITDSGIIQCTNNIVTSGGDGFKPGGGSWAVYSDARLKEDAAPLTGALDKITQLNPVTYKWKYNTSEITTGFIAQEVREVMPTAVGEADPLDKQKPFIPDGEKALSVSWKNDMMAYLVGAIKELKSDLDAAKARIAELEAK